MALRDLVNHPVGSTEYQAYAAKIKGNPEPSAAGTFITPQSLVAFPFAAGLVAACWKGAQTLFPVWGPSPWVALIIAFGIGILVSLVSLSDDRLKLGPREKAIAFGIGLLNCFYLFLTALGIGPK
jgi:threonine/homoserine efflux transporter RhtA